MYKYDIKTGKVFKISNSIRGGVRLTICDLYDGGYIKNRRTDYKKIYLTEDNCINFDEFKKYNKTS